MSSASAREAILDAVRRGRPSAVGAPEVAATVRRFPPAPGGATERFSRALLAAGGHVTETTPEGVPRTVALAAGAARRVLSTVAGVPSTVASPDDPRQLDDLDLFVCAAALGVAENGAVWLAMARQAERAALFLATTVIVLVERATVVADLHAAYATLDLAAHPFGVFVAGPSKTADIEQSLVIGAHGPKQLIVVLVRSAGGGATT
jgi:L-lactate dehydrogenase complex protein LldG